MKSSRARPISVVSRMLMEGWAASFGWSSRTTYRPTASSVRMSLPRPRRSTWCAVTGISEEVGLSFTAVRISGMWRIRISAPGTGTEFRRLDSEVQRQNALQGWHKSVLELWDDEADVHEYLENCRRTLMHAGERTL